MHRSIHNFRDRDCINKYVQNKIQPELCSRTAVIPAVVQLIIMLVNGNIGEGIAVAEAFILVRFRSAPGSAREICSIFPVMAAGLATGMDYVAQQGENRNIAIFIDCYDDLRKIYTVKSCPLLQWQCV